MKLFVMTGGFGSGKTTWISRMLERAAQRQLGLAGVYTPAVFEEGEKVAIDAVLLPSGQRFEFAPKLKGVQADGLKRLGWDFQDSAMARINAHLRTCVGCDLFVVDELGPLELLRGQGYVQALELLDAQAVSSALVVVRPALLDEVRARWGSFEAMTPESSVSAFLDTLV